MKFHVLFSTVTLFLSTPRLAASSAESHRRDLCTTPKVRKEWRAAAAEERSSYINAVLCLATKPSKLGFDSTTIYDDFTYVHANSADYVHSRASFLPWHRYFIQLYENELIACGHKGALLYWDFQESADTLDDMRNDPIFSPSTGFGGNGNSSTDILERCLIDGPFVNIKPAYWRDEPAPGCITRRFFAGNTNLRPLAPEAYNAAVITQLLGETNYAGFRTVLEHGCHAIVHTVIGGEMVSLQTSTNDPLFFLLHANVDRLWVEWQQQDPINRNSDYDGYNAPYAAGNLSTPLHMWGFAPNRTVADFMLPQGEYSCHTYE